MPGEGKDGNDQIADIGAVLDEQVIRTGYDMSGFGPASAFAGGIISAGINAYSNYKNREWMERMSNTAHQREVADLRRAGLNPILSATGGHGASTPSNSAPDLSSVGTGVASAGRMATYEKMMLSAQLELMDAQRGAAAASAADSNASALKKASETEGVKIDNEWMAKSRRATIESLLSSARLNNYSARQLKLGPLGTIAVPDVKLHWNDGQKDDGTGGASSARDWDRFTGHY